MASDPHFPFPEPEYKGEVKSRQVERELQIRTQHSPTIGELVKALAKAQLKFDPIFKENDNPAFRSKYADLATVIAATQKHMAAEGLVLMQFPTTAGKDLILHSMLAHSSGEWLSSDLTMPATMRERFDAQSIGSASTYARRYAWQAITGTSADIDDDGNEASGQGSSKASIAVATKKLAGKTESLPSLFYFALPEQEDLYEITGAQSLLEAYRGVLKKFWNLQAKAIIVNGEQLEGLKYQFEQASVPFTLLKK